MYLEDWKCVNNCTTTNGQYVVNDAGEKVCTACDGDHYVVFDENIEIRDTDGKLI